MKHINKQLIVFTLIILIISCKSTNEKFFSLNSGTLLLSKPGIPSDSVSRVEMFRVDGQKNWFFGSIPDIKNNAQIYQILENEAEARNFVFQVQEGEVYQFRRPDNYKVTSTWHVLIYFNDIHKLPAYWIIERVYSKQEYFYILFYDMKSGSMRYFKDIKLDDNGPLLIGN